MKEERRVYVRERERERKREKERIPPNIRSGKRAAQGVHANTTSTKQRECGLALLSGHLGGRNDAFLR
jgi:hypothetical protein